MSRKRKANGMSSQLNDHVMDQDSSGPATNHLHDTNDDGFTTTPIQTWTPEQVAKYLSRKGHPEAAKIFSGECTIITQIKHSLILFLQNYLQFI